MKSNQLPHHGGDPFRDHLMHLHKVQHRWNPESWQELPLFPKHPCTTRQQCQALNYPPHCCTLEKGALCSNLLHKWIGVSTLVKSTILNICSSRVQCSAEVPLFQCSVRAEWPFCSEGNPVDCCPANIFHSFHPSLILAITKSIIISIISIVFTPRSADNADYGFIAKLSPQSAKISISHPNS